MQLTNHLTDRQLNEYLDNESEPGEREMIDLHLSLCIECTARLAKLQALFNEIASLPDLALSKPLAVQFAPDPGLTPQLPRWLTLTATLQAVFAIIAITIAAPLVITLLPAIETPSLTDMWIPIQSQWLTWLDTLSQFQIPQLPELSMSIEISSALTFSALAGLFMFWIVGNGLLLRNQTK